jgi:hypothetical protein
MKENGHHWASRQYSTQSEILLLLKKTCCITSILTLTKRHMHVIHVNNFLRSVGRLPVVVILG